MQVVRAQPCPNFAQPSCQMLDVKTRKFLLKGDIQTEICCFTDCMPKLPLHDFFPIRNVEFNRMCVPFIINNSALYPDQLPIVGAVGVRQEYILCGAPYTHIHTFAQFILGHHFQLNVVQI